MCIIVTVCRCDSEMEHCEKNMALIYYMKSKKVLHIYHINTCPHECGLPILFLSCSLSSLSLSLSPIIL